MHTRTCAHLKNEVFVLGLVNGQHVPRASTLLQVLGSHDWVLKAIHVNKQRLVRQRRIKRNLFQQQEVIMTKKEVNNKKLGPFVIMPSTINPCFKVWWKDLPNDHQVSEWYPFNRHGLAGEYRTIICDPLCEKGPLSNSRFEPWKLKIRGMLGLYVALR